MEVPCWRGRFHDLNKSKLLDSNKSKLLYLNKSNCSTEPIKKPFKLDGKRRKLDPNRPAPHTLRNRSGFVWKIFIFLKNLPIEINKCPGRR